MSPEQKLKSPAPIYSIRHGISNLRFALAVSWMIGLALVLTAVAVSVVATAGYLPLLAVPVIVGLGVYYLLHVFRSYLSSRRIDFYQEFVYVVPHIGRPVRAAYQELWLEKKAWKDGTSKLGILWSRNERRQVCVFPDRWLKDVKMNLTDWLAQMTAGKDMG